MCRVVRSYSRSRLSHKQQMVRHLVVHPQSPQHHHIWFDTWRRKLSSAHNTLVHRWDINPILVNNLCHRNKCYRTWYHHVVLLLLFRKSNRFRFRATHHNATGSRCSALISPHTAMTSRRVFLHKAATVARHCYTKIQLVLRFPYIKLQLVTWYSYTKLLHSH